MADTENNTSETAKKPKNPISATPDAVRAAWQKRIRQTNARSAEPEATESVATPAAFSAALKQERRNYNNEMRSFNDSNSLPYGTRGLSKENLTTYIPSARGEIEEEPRKTHLTLQEAIERVDKTLKNGSKETQRGTKKPLTVRVHDKEALINYVFKNFPDTNTLEASAVRYWLRALRLSLGFNMPEMGQILHQQYYTNFEETVWPDHTCITNIITGKEALGLTLSDEQENKLRALAEALRKRARVTKNVGDFDPDNEFIPLETAKARIDYVLATGSKETMKKVAPHEKEALFAFIFEKMPNNDSCQGLNKDAIERKCQYWFTALRLAAEKTAVQASKIIGLGASAWGNVEGNWPNRNFIKSVTEHFKDLTGVELTNEQKGRLDAFNNFLDAYRGRTRITPRTTGFSR